MTCPQMEDPLAPRLRRHLPLRAHVGPLLGSKLRRYGRAGGAVVVTNVYDAGHEFGLMCQLDLSDICGDAPALVVPIAQLVFDRACPISRELTDYRRRCRRGA